jgi:hypothetical protein
MIKSLVSVASSKKIHLFILRQLRTKLYEQVEACRILVRKDSNSK